MKIPCLVSRAANRLSLGHLKMGWWSAPFTSNECPIIIAGSPRTGSTLLRVMLNNHPDVWIGPENSVLQESGQNISSMSKCLDLPEERIRQVRRSSYSLGEFIDRIMAESLRREGKRIWGIKTPAMVLDLDDLFRYFPKARFIHILRDGRDVVCSLRTHPKYMKKNGERVPTHITNPWGGCVQKWVQYTTCGLRWRQDPRYFEIRYEELTSTPGVTLRKCIDWLELPFSNRVLNHSEKPLDEISLISHLEVSKRVCDSAVSRWKTDLTEEAWDAFGDDAAKLLIDLGYVEGTDIRQ